VNYPEVESLDIDRVIHWFAARGIEAVRHPRHPSEPSPDLQLRAQGALIGYCEVKSLGLGPWDWSNAGVREDGLWEFQGNFSGTIDKTKARLANAIVKASKQVAHATAGSNLLKVVAVVGHGPDTDRLDAQAVMRGFEKRAGLPPYSEAENPNKALVTARKEIDAVIWMGPDNDQHLMLNECDPTRHQRCREWLLDD
jgi:hypothetical protein